MARKKGSSNRGYYFRKGRGWVVTDRESYVLRDEAGKKLIDRKTSEAVLRDAFIAYRIAVEQEAAAKPVDDSGNAVAILDVARTFLEYSKGTDSPKTYQMRRKYLFDFVTGLPDRYMDASESEMEKAKREGTLKRIHSGYATRLVSTLTKMDVLQWCKAHPKVSARNGWGEGGGQKAGVQALKRCLNWAVEFGVIKSNPIVGYPVKESEARVTFIEPERLQKFYDQAAPDFALAMKVLVTTGARYGCEFAALTAKHIVQVDEGKQKWVWQTGSKVRKKRRIIYVKEAWLINLVNELCVKHPSGPIFRPKSGKPWTNDAMKKRWERMKDALLVKGVEFDPDDCLYSLRHTFAKNELAKGISIEKLAKRMGNTPQVCWRHYGQWCNRNEELAWED